MPRKPKQQTLVAPPGKDPSNFAGTEAARDKMAKLRAMRGQHVEQAAVALRTGIPAKNPMVTAIDTLEQLRSMAGVLKVSGIAGQLPEAAVIALLLKGLELGIGPVEAVQSLWLTQEGTIEANAELMRALVGRSGLGVIEITTYSDGVVAVTARRYGIGGRPDTTQEFVYTVQDAQRAGIFDDKWRKWPRAMCLARVSSEAGRAMFPDVLLGAGYAPGEVGGEIRIEDTPADAPEAGPGQPMLPDRPDPVPTPQPVAPAPPESAPAAAPEPATAPPPPPPALPPRQEAAAAPETRTALPTPPPTSVNGLPELVYEFAAEAPGGGIRIVKTAGILKEQLQRIGDLTTPRAGQPKWQELQTAARGWLREAALPDLKYLTQAQGEQLIAALTGHPSLGGEIPRASSEQEQAVDAVLAETATQHLRDKVYVLLTKTKGVEQVSQIPMPDLRQMLAEVRGMITDPQVFGLMLEQVLASAPAA